MNQARIGAGFENHFYTQCVLHGVAVTRIPNGCKYAGRKLVREKSPWDWVITFRGLTALIDTKTTADPWFKHSHIEEHQVEALLPHARNGVPSGYVIDFRAHQLVVFVSAEDLAKRLYRDGSIRIDDPGLIGLGGAFEFDPRLIFTPDRVQPTKAVLDYPVGG